MPFKVVPLCFSAPLIRLVSHLRASITFNELDNSNVEIVSKHANFSLLVLYTKNPHGFPPKTWKTLLKAFIGVSSSFGNSLCLSMMHTVILDGATLNPGDLSWGWISELSGYTLYENTPPEEIIQRSKDADILLVNKVVLAKTHITSLPKLRFIMVTATGINNVDINACRAMGIGVSNVTNYGTTTVAQHVFGLLLALTNKTWHHHQMVQTGEWMKRGSFSFWDAPLIELAGKTIGIIGYGNIGREVGRIANGFRMKVTYNSASAHVDEIGEAIDLETLIRQSDVVTLHTHLHDNNREMINSDFLNGMKQSAYLINTARGGLINEIDLRHALMTGSIAGAGLDVLSKEPPPDDHPLLHLENCIITPHNAWASVEARQRMMDIVKNNIRKFLSGKPINLVN